MSILSRPLIHPAQRFDLEDFRFLLSQLRADAKYNIAKFWSPRTYILQGFSVISTSSGSVTIEQAGGALVNASNTGSFSWFSETSTAADLIVTTTEGLTFGTRNYIELSLKTEDGVPLSRAIWDASLQSGLGEEFSQIVNTVTDMEVEAVARLGGFSAGDDTIPVAIIDVDGGGNSTLILDARNLFFRLGTAADPENEFTWGSRVDSELIMTVSSVVGTFQVGETITFDGTETAVVTDISALGSGELRANRLSANTITATDPIVGLSSGATCTLDLVRQAFNGADKDIANVKDSLNAIMTEIKHIKGTNFWFELSSSSISGLSSFLNSVISPISTNASVFWDGSDLSITDDSLTPAGSDVIARIRRFGKAQELDLTRQDATSAPIPLADGQVLLVKVPELASRAFTGIGTANTEYQVVDLIDFSSDDESYWLAYREGSKLLFRGVGELESGESSQIGDNIPSTLLDALGFDNEVDMPTYTSDIRGSASESLVDRISALTDAMGDYQEDRSAYFRSDDIVVWDGSELTFTEDIELKILNTKGGSITTHTILAAASPLALTDGQIAYIAIDRTIDESVTFVVAASIPAQTQATKDYIPVFQRIDVAGAGYLHIPMHKQVLEPGQSVRLGASGAGGGEGAAFGLLLDELPYRVGSRDSFDNRNLVDSTETTANYSAANKAFNISYDSDKTATTISTDLGLSAAPAFALQIGDLIIANSEVREITALGTINTDGGTTTPATIDSAFAADLTADACIISQKVQSLDLLNYFDSSDPESRPSSELVGHILLSNKAINDFDHAEQPDWLTPQVDDIILQYTGGTLYETYITVINSTTNFTVNDASSFNNGTAFIIRPSQMASYLVSYRDDGFVDSINAAFQAITAPDLAANWNLESIYTRNLSSANEIPTRNILGTLGGHFYLRFFSNLSTGSGTITLFDYDSAFYEEPQFNNSGVHNQAYCRTDGAGTEINCVVSVVGSKTRITLADDFPSFVSGVNSGNPFGDLIVHLDGKEIPRYVDASLTPNESYTEDVNGLYIDLDSDYSGSSLSVSLVRRVGSIDTSDLNSTRISVLESGFTTVVGANLTITDIDTINRVYIDTNGADRDVNLPSAATNIGRSILIVKTNTDAFQVDINPDGAETIQGLASVNIDCQYGRVLLRSDGSNWICEDYHFTDKQYSQADGDFTVTGTNWTTTRLWVCLIELLMEHGDLG
jgi:hypothetical protein